MAHEALVYSEDLTMVQIKETFLGAFKQLKPMLVLVSVLSALPPTSAAALSEDRAWLELNSCIEVCHTIHKALEPYCLGDKTCLEENRKALLQCLGGC